MRVQSLVGIRELRLIDKPIPLPAASDVIVRVEFCGLCGTDVHCYGAAGQIVPLGTVLGHEIVGVVSDIGDAVAGFAPGDRVAVNPIPSCGRCFWCRRGQPVLCAVGIAEEVGLTGHNDGGFAEYVRVRSPQTMLYRLPDSMSFVDAALVEPLATSLHAVRSSRFKTGDYAMVLGAGMIGLGVLEFLRIGGAGRIDVVEPSAAKGELARRLGATRVIDPMAEPENAAEEPDGIGPDVIYECSGSPKAFLTALRRVRKGGQVVLIGFRDKEVTFPVRDAILKGIELKTALGYNDEFAHVIRFLDNGAIRSDLFLTGIIPLEDVEAGMRRMQMEPDVIKLLIKPTPSPSSV
jgi:2-desacetyl-2-hydroxyethyl bacteriochlorophyllide A dehydrogenase